MSVTKAGEFIKQAAREADQTRRHLLVAAAFTEILTHEPVVVGGTAEEFWTQDEYHPTDLDLCVPLATGDDARLEEAGFRKEGRHWVSDEIPTVAVEIPASRLDGDIERAYVARFDGTEVRVIGLDDLYLDRLRQATANPSPGTTEFSSTLAVATARYEDLDRGYIERRLREIALSEPDTGAEMKRLDRLIQRKAREALTDR